MTHLSPFLWFDGEAEEAARFYAATFPDSRVDAVVRSPTDLPAGRAGSVLTAMMGMVRIDIPAIERARRGDGA